MSSRPTHQIKRTDHSSLLICNVWELFFLIPFCLLWTESPSIISLLPYWYIFSISGFIFSMSFPKCGAQHWIKYPAKSFQRQSVEGWLHKSQWLYSILYNLDGIFAIPYKYWDLTHFPTEFLPIFRLFPQCLLVLKSRIQWDVFYCSYGLMVVMIQHIK